MGTNFENMCRFATVQNVGCKKGSGLENKVGLLDFLKKERRQFGLFSFSFSFLGD